MAIEYLKNGLASFENREVYFEKGSPVDPEIWPLFKNIPNDSYNTEVSYYLINRCFSPVKDLSGLTIRSSMDQFKVFCEHNNLKFVDNYTSVIIKKK